jgi:thioredoxin 1
MEAMTEGAEPTRSEIDSRTGPLVIEFGAGWCGVCRAAQPMIGAARESNPGVEHLKVEDGPGRPLGRSFGVKLWPTLVFLRDGREVARLVRPARPEDLALAYRKLAG